MKTIILILSLALLAILYSCSTKLDINAPAKDITVVFGLLDQNDSAHYVRITKAFIGSQDALVMAQNPANSSYDDELQVVVNEISNGNNTNTFPCTKTIITNKDSGIFYYPHQEVYVFTGTINPVNQYELDIKNNVTGKEVTAQTGLIGDFSIGKPYWNPSNPIISFFSNGSYTTGDLSWTSVANGRLYEPLFRFNYQEVDTTAPQDTVNKYVDWKLAGIKSSNLTGGEQLQSSYNSESFYIILGSSIPVDRSKRRFIGKVDFMLSVGGDELSTYIDLNTPSNTIVQERPAYTNVTNGIGIFSCRHTKKLSFKLSQFSVTELISGYYTGLLGFQ